MKIVQLKDGLATLNKGVTKLKKILEGFPEPSFTTEEYINTYTYTSSLAVYFCFYDQLLRSKLPCDTYSLCCTLFGWMLNLRLIFNDWLQGGL